MTTVRSILGWLVPAMILGAAIAIFVLLGQQPPPERKRPEEPVATPIETVEAAREKDGVAIALDGVVVPLREVKLAAEVPGRIQRKAAACKAGKFVTQGTPLFEIDPRDFELEVTRLEREVSQAGLSIEEADEEIAQNATAVELAQQQLELARREVRRLDGLRQGRIVTEAEHDRAVREELAVTSTLAGLEGQSRVLRKRRDRLEEAKSLAETMLDKARLDLSRTRVFAPADGVVVEDHVEQDSYVSKGMPLVTIEDTSAAEVRTSLEMDEVARVWRSAEHGDRAAGDQHGLPDTPATVSFTIGDQAYEWAGTLSRQEGRGLDEKTRTLPCRVIVAEPTKVRAVDRYGAAIDPVPAGAPGALMRGMFVQVKVHVDSPHELVSIPEQARRPTGEVWLDRGGRLVILRPRPVQVAGGRAVFESEPSGLVAGDRVITSQVSHPRDGMAVAEPKRAAAAPAAAATTEGRDDT
ncbi:MAG: HlyD family efflux transporter periplasmic adaptor subunit [Planctomycetes bacterium]|nr:HlyD family efflux transporter periplasmic adaptor subunit [Planctomycetota bacterium]